MAAANGSCSKRNMLADKYGVKETEGRERGVRGKGEREMEVEVVVLCRGTGEITLLLGMGRRIESG